MWPSENKYRSILRNSVFLTHRIEPDKYGYEHGLAWFCSDTYRHISTINNSHGQGLGFLDYSQDDGISCRETFHANAPENRKITIQLTQNDVNNVIDLGDVSLMNKIANKIPDDVSITLEGNNTLLKNVLLWTTHNDDVFNAIPDDSMFVIRACDWYNTCSLSCMALDIHYYQPQITVTKEEMKAKLKSIDEAVLRNYHNNDAINIMLKILSVHPKYVGWSYKSNKVFRFRQELRQGNRTYVFFEKEPSEYLLKLNNIKFDEFKIWVRQHFNDVQFP
tara:strand:- start:1804 stop:2634 length:831 start_codon:yes stop_codon:yes gene_type:complete